MVVASQKAQESVTDTLDGHQEKMMVLVDFIHGVVSQDLTLGYRAKNLELMSRELFERATAVSQMVGIRDAS